MSIAEPERPEMSPQEQALVVSPILQAFLEDSTDRYRWQEKLHAYAVPIIEELEINLGDKMGEAVTNSLLSYAVVDGVLTKNRKRKYKQCHLL